MRRLIFATAMLAAASAAPAIAAPQSWQEYGPGTGVVRCESNDGRMNRCSLPGGGGRVVLERQHSRTACIEGRSWGQDRGGVWVDDGCRADFRVAGYGGGYNDGYYGGGYGNGAPPSGGNGGIGCPSCKTLNAPGARFCQQCGMSLVPAVCKQCGALLQAGAKFCGQCGQNA